jgi:hypothetical protein
MNNFGTNYVNWAGCGEKAAVFVPGKALQPDLIIASKTGAYLSVCLILASLDGRVEVL